MKDDCQTTRRLARHQLRSRGRRSSPPLPSPCGLRPGSGRTNRLFGREKRFGNLNRALGLTGPKHGSLAWLACSQGAWRVLMSQADQDGAPLRGSLATRPVSEARLIIAHGSTQPALDQMDSICANRHSKDIVIILLARSPWPAPHVGLCELAGLSVDWAHLQVH